MTDLAPNIRERDLARALKRAETGDLFDDTRRHFRAIEDARNRARRTDPETSRAAAKDATRAAPIGRILALRLLGIRPHTDFELAAATGWQQTSIGKRRGELVALGFVAPLFTAAGERVTRPAPSGSAASVWQITELGRAMLRTWEATK